MTFKIHILYFHTSKKVIPFFLLNITFNICLSFLDRTYIFCLLNKLLEFNYLEKKMVVVLNHKGNAPTLVKIDYSIFLFLCT